MSNNANGTGHYGRRADLYAGARPQYPSELFDHLVGLCAGRDLAWDCGTGSGQAARALVGRFRRVVATDLAPEMIARAAPVEGIEFRVAPSAASGLPDRSVDLITVAQALHWFDADAFAREAHRVARPGGVFAAWCYRTPEVAPEIDRLVAELYDAPELAPLWPPERGHVDDGYARLPIPFDPVPVPRFAIRDVWPWARFESYLRTWPAVSAAEGVPNVSRAVAERFARLASAWGTTEARPVRWELTLRTSILSRR